jgi:hypothetical protein
MSVRRSPEAVRLKTVKGRRHNDLSMQRKQRPSIQDEQDSSIIAQEWEIPDGARDLSSLHRPALSFHP